MIVGFATGLRSTVQSLGWLGVRAGIFARLAVELEVRRIAVTGPEAAAGLVRGDWEFCETGTVPVVEGVLKGEDPVIILAPSGPFTSYVIARPGISHPSELLGGKIGVLSQTGQNTVAASIWMRSHDLTAALVPLGSFENEYAELLAGTIDAAYLPIDFRFRAERELGATAFPVNAGLQGAIVACTRRLIARDPDLVARVVRGYIETIRWFKTQPDAAVPLLQEFLQFSDRSGVEDLHAFFVDQFQVLPRPSEEGIRKVLGQFVDRYPQASTLPLTAVVDTSFVDQLG